MIEEAHEPVYPPTSAKGRVLSVLQEFGAVRASFIKDMTALKRGAIRTTVSRLRDDGWDIICKRDTSGPKGQASDPKYELLTAKETSNE